MTFTSHKSQISAPRVTNTLNKRAFAEKHIFQQTSFLFLSTQAVLLHFEAMLMWFPSGFVGCTTDLSSRSSARMLVKMALRNLFPNSYDFPFSSKLFLLVHVRKTEDTNGELSKMEGCVLERRENKRRKREEKTTKLRKSFWQNAWRTSPVVLLFWSRRSLSRSPQPLILWSQHCTWRKGKNREGLRWERKMKWKVSHWMWAASSSLVPPLVVGEGGPLSTYSWAGCSWTRPAFWFS